MKSTNAKSKKTCTTSSKGLKLLAGVAYFTYVRNFLDANCVSCHGLQSVQGLDFQSYSAAEDSLEATGRSFNTLVNKVQSDHSGRFSFTDTQKDMFATWRVDGYPELLPGETRDMYMNNNSNSGGNSDLPEYAKRFLENQKNDSSEDNSDANANADSSSQNNSSNIKACD